MFSFFSFTCSLKNLPVPKIEVSTFELSINPADESSSIFGKSDNFWRLKWLKKSSVVIYCIGLTVTFFLPEVLTQLSYSSISKVPVAKDTPRISSISDLVTG